LLLDDTVPAVERWAIGLAPSAAVAATLWRERPPGPALGQPLRILALGDPAFKDERGNVRSTESETYRSAFDAKGGLPRLAGSGNEAREVARFAPGGAEIRLRDQASEQWFKHAPLDRFRVIHLATHALVDESSLARTALALAPGAGEDGFLSPADLAGLHLSADLVVLSACRTASGVAVTGEGIEGLTTPLLTAGARSVVATQWRIGDRSTIRLVHDFYEQLAQGAPVAEALRSAKLVALHRGAPAAEWAGFTVVGDPWARVAVEEPRPAALSWWAVAGIGIALMAGAGYWLTRRMPIGRLG
jgi:CHAT domain-containing protein